MEKWLSFSRYGDQIPNSPFVAFKCPIENPSFHIPIEHRFHFSDVFSIFPSIGLVIDLTATSKYYDPETVTRFGVLYQKICIKGHGFMPDQLSIDTFNEVVDRFLYYNPNHLIGVHCTHGVNRTGFLICQYMMRRFKMLARTAINYFRVGRHHHIERSNYVNALVRLDEDDLYRSRISTRETPNVLTLDHRHVANQRYNYQLPYRR